MGETFVMFFLWLVPILSIKIEKKTKMKTVERDILKSTSLKVKMLNITSKLSLYGFGVNNIN